MATKICRGAYLQLQLSSLPVRLPARLESWPDVRGQTSPRQSSQRGGAKRSKRSAMRNLTVKNKADLPVTILGVLFVFLLPANYLSACRKKDTSCKQYRTFPDGIARGGHPNPICSASSRRDWD